MFKILVVEDDKDLNKTVCSFLNYSGYEAIGCLNVNDAYDVFTDHVIDLIVSDIMMPGIDGFEFAANVRELNEEIPILFMTAKDDIASKKRGFRIGVDDYMVKPVDFDELFYESEHCFAERKSQRIRSWKSADESFIEIIDCFNTMAEELAGVETLRTDFVANVSHELKTPLSVMQNYGTLLQMPELEETKRMEYAKGVDDGSRRLADMMTNILKLNKLEKQQIFPKTEEYDLGEQLCECLLQLENVWEEKQIEIETEIEGGVKVCTDVELLSLVWNNLFSNAFKFTPEGGTVSIVLEATESHAIVKVKDTGCGMSPEVGKHIFEKFYQGDTSHAMQGNGLGLALVKRVIDILSGEISVESAIGKGSTFIVKFQRI